MEAGRRRGRGGELRTVPPLSAYLLGSAYYTFNPAVELRTVVTSGPARVAPHAASVVPHAGGVMPHTGRVAARARRPCRGPRGSSGGRGGARRAGRWGHHRAGRRIRLVLVGPAPARGDRQERREYGQLPHVTPSRFGSRLTRCADLLAHPGGTQLGDQCGTGSSRAGRWPPGGREAGGAGGRRGCEGEAAARGAGTWGRIRLTRHGSPPGWWLAMGRAPGRVKCAIMREAVNRRYLWPPLDHLVRG